MTTAKKKIMKKGLRANKGVALHRGNVRASVRGGRKGDLLAREAVEVLRRAEAAESSRGLKQLTGQSAEGSALRDALAGGVIDAEPPIAMSSGDMIRELRRLQNFTQDQLAKRAGTTQAAISALESGEQTLGLERAKVLATALGVHPGVLAFPGWKVRK
jgi:DNA-binding XRE family transcriptional regulator